MSQFIQNFDVLFNELTDPTKNKFLNYCYLNNFNLQEMHIDFKTSLLLYFLKYKIDTEYIDLLCNSNSVIELQNLQNFMNFELPDFTRLDEKPPNYVELNPPMYDEHDILPTYNDVTMQTLK